MASEKDSVLFNPLLTQTQSGSCSLLLGESRNLIVFGLKEEEEEWSPLISSFFEVVEREFISKRQGWAGSEQVQLSDQS